ncbi:entry exclusion lipoprotein TrbK [Vibrio parahaemolyticus]|nr:entry exclusion lipoprotein TrbK [Vibrio parahaemolyticus]MDG3393007.1 entry exclusion lipoprotein TrbK [Vibrio parahaemolyticus]MDG3403442.1 entry exclusion lipoprotein TrbK [Vibrio parahaemolyticus]
MKKSILPILAVVTVLLIGCEDISPEANKVTCTGEAYRQALSEIKSAAKRQVFSSECESFRKAQQMGKWEFNPSPEDDF